MIFSTKKTKTASVLIAALLLLSGCTDRRQRAELVPTLTSFTEETEATETSIPETEGAEETEETDPQGPVYSDEVYAIVDQMTLEEKIYQLFIITPEQFLDMEKPVYPEDYLTATSESLEAELEETPVAGVVFFAGNITDPEQITEFTGIFTQRGMFTAVDEEGGDITRIASNPSFDVAQFPPMGEVNDSYQVGLDIGTYLQDYGFNLDFAPVADVASDPWNDVIGNRSFGDDPVDVSMQAEACVEGFTDAGIACTLKHFPGHGTTSGDSHYGAALLDKTLAELQAEELMPFEYGIEADVPFIMVGHITVPEVTGDLPATLSEEAMTELLRDQMGYQGVIITDSFQMGAITDNWESDEAAVAAILAGADIILMPDDFDLAVQGIEEAVQNGTITEERIDQSVLRIIQTKTDYGIM